MGSVPWKLTVVVDQDSPVTAGFDPRRYDPAGVRAMLAQLVRLVERTTVAPEGRVGDLPAAPRPRDGWLRRVFGRRARTEG
jgi:hypothetical protein